MFLERGWVFTHETVREWETQFAPLLAEQLRAKRRGQAGQSWYVDETYVRVPRSYCQAYPTHARTDQDPETNTHADPKTV
jgi:transposase-like protein